MKSAFLLSAAFAVGLAAAQDISPDDLPSDCISACTPIVTRAVTCEAQNDDDDAELQCICDGSGITAAIQACNACIAPYRGSGDDDDDYSDIQELANACGVPSASVSGAPTVTAISTSTYTTTSTDDDGEVDTDVDETTIFSTISGSAAAVSSTVITTTNGSGNTITTTSRTTPTATGAAAGGDSNSSSTTGNFAVHTAAPMLGAGAALALGALAVL